MTHYEDNYKITVRRSQEEGPQPSIGGAMGQGGQMPPLKKSRGAVPPLKLVFAPLDSYRSRQALAPLFVVVLKG